MNLKDNKEDQNINSHFLQLVMGLQSSAWMLLGKMANPLTEEVEKNLEGAKATIDTLLMIKTKTRGNLTQAEEELLNNALQELEVNFIEESKKPDIRLPNKKNNNRKKNDPKD